MAYDLLCDIGIGDSVALNLNTLGDQESRDRYRKALVDYFTPLKDQLSEDSKRRLLENPLRILDSKEDGDKSLIKDAPKFGDYLTQESKTFFDQVCGALTALNIPFTKNEALVRGLDYYCHTAFEFISTELGAQGTVLAGGRYNGLVADLGGPDVSGVGWAAGVERLAMLSKLETKSENPVVFMPLCEAAEIPCLQLAQVLTRESISVETLYNGNIGKRLKRAEKYGAKFVILMGEDELSSSQVQLKSLETGESILLAMPDVLSYIQEHA